ncbi:glycine betaine ABC transporter substrate-binding protein [Desulforamulus ruminis]|uniref:glycine betaine ABC transporter substrate-binding protein n=1 Tax=Desulforamulus ruminis TaxID=1564 RepID=UPI002FDAD2E7
MRKKAWIKLLLFIMPLLLVLSACARTEAPKGGEEGEAKIRVASKPFTESYILAEIMMQLLAQDTKLTVEYKAIEGGTTSILHPALMKGEIDLYPEYTGTGWLDVLKKGDTPKDSQELYRAVKEEYLKEYNLVWLPMFGFNNTFTLALTAEKQQEDQLKTFSDLSKVANQYVFGSEPDFFERKDGYEGLVQAYGFQFKKAEQMAIALKYPAIDSGKVDVINAFSTDGLLKRYNMVTLQDDKNYFPSYFCAPVVRKDVLEKHPEIETALKKLEGQITDEDMTEMNYKVDEKKLDPKQVAKEFLESKGLLK